MGERTPIGDLPPIASAQSILKQLRNRRVTRVLVGYSGGKDSLCTLQLALDFFGKDNVQPFFLYMLKNLDCDEELLSIAEKRYKLKIDRLPSPEIVNMLKNCYGRRHIPSIQRLINRKYGWNEAEKIVRFRHDRSWILYGHRCQDSLQRRGMLTRCQGVWETTEKTLKPIHRAYPLWQWSHKHVISYLKAKHIPIPHMYGSTAINTSGLALHDPKVLRYLREHFPHDYARLKAVFPMLEVPLHRQDVLNELDKHDP